jgi:hypothetical protein
MELIFYKNREEGREASREAGREGEGKKEIYIPKKKMGEEHYLD